MSDDSVGGKAMSNDDPSGDELVRVTVTMTMGQHHAIKRAAREADTTVSGLVRAWMTGGPQEKYREDG